MTACCSGASLSKSWYPKTGPRSWPGTLPRPYPASIPWCFQWRTFSSKSASSCVFLHNVAIKFVSTSFSFFFSCSSSGVMGQVDIEIRKTGNKKRTSTYELESAIAAAHWQETAAAPSCPCRWASPGRGSRFQSGRRSSWAEKKFQVGSYMLCPSETCCCVG